MERYLTEFSFQVALTSPHGYYFIDLYDELVAMRSACGDAHMKSILAVGELTTLTNVYKASVVAMMAGSDFIKTSTGTI